MKKILRSIQTLFPYLHDIRFSFKLLIMKLTKRPHESDFKAFNMFKPDADQVFIDIGSNRGEAILSMLVVSNFETRIIGFEPNPLVFSKLKNYFRQNRKVELYNCGLGSENQKLDLYIPFYRKWMFDGLSSFKYDSAESWLRSRLWRFNEQKLSIKKVNCQIRKLDEFQLNPYFIKIDIQGYELDALQGGYHTLNTHKPILLIESISTEVIEFLEQFDYQFFSFSNDKFNKGIGKLNTYCITEEKFDELSLS